LEARSGREPVEPEGPNNRVEAFRHCRLL
jgi:hypothetical protein